MPDYQKAVRDLVIAIIVIALILLVILGIASLFDFIRNRRADPMSDLQKDEIARELHAKKGEILGGSFREARDLVKTTQLDVVLHEDIRTKKPDSVAGFRALLDS